MTAQTFDVWINGTLRKSAAPFENAATTFDRVSGNGWGAGNGGTWWMDCFSVHQEMPLLAPFGAATVYSHPTIAVRGNSIYLVVRRYIGANDYDLVFKRYNPATGWDADETLIWNSGSALAFPNVLRTVVEDKIRGIVTNITPSPYQIVYFEWPSPPEPGERMRWGKRFVEGALQPYATPA